MAVRVPEVDMVPREPERMPHLLGEGAEFLALADCRAVVDGVSIPFHSHVLARSSRVFAQLFLTFSARPTSPAPPSPTPDAASVVTDVSDLLQPGYDLATTLTTAFLLYNSDKATVQAAFDQHKWAVAEPGDGINIELDSSLLQDVVGLADKLDARRLLHEVEAVCARGLMLRKDLLGWLATGLRLHLPWLRDRALTEIVHTLKNTPCSTALALLRDPRWKDLDPALLLLLIDGLTAHKFRPAHSQFSLVAGQWKEMGDLTAAMSAATISPEGAGAGHQGLEALEEAHLLQAQEQWEEAFDLAGIDSEFGEEEEEEQLDEEGDGQW